MTTEQQIHRMQQNYEKMADDMDEVKGMLAQVKEAIMGNPVSGDGGLSARLSKLEKKVEWYDRMKWLVIGAAATSGMAINELLTKILR